MIFINPIKLPSKGKFNNSIILETIEYPYLTLQEMTSFDIDMANQKKETLKKRLEIFHLLIKREEFREKFLNFSVYDLNSILYLIKVLSVPHDDVEFYNLSVECSKCKAKTIYKTPLSEITFIDPPEDLLNLRAVVINGKQYEVKMPTIKEFFTLLQTMGDILTLKEIYVMSFIKNITINEIKQGHYKEMAIIDYVYDLVTTNITYHETFCPKCKGGVEIDFNNISHTFQDLVNFNVTLERGSDLLFDESPFGIE
jgi:hypothetical protein